MAPLAGVGGWGGLIHVSHPHHQAGIDLPVGYEKNNPPTYLPTKICSTSNPALAIHYRINL